MAVTLVVGATGAVLVGVANVVTCTVIGLSFVMVVVAVIYSLRGVREEQYCYDMFLLRCDLCELPWHLIGV